MLEASTPLPRRVGQTRYVLVALALLLPARLFAQGAPAAEPATGNGDDPAPAPKKPLHAGAPARQR
jgi:hypothetical protein